MRNEIDIRLTYLPKPGPVFEAKVIDIISIKTMSGIVQEEIGR